MTTIIVKPIDMSAPGSFRQRQKMMKASAIMQRAQAKNDMVGMYSALLEIHDIFIANCSTDDGTPLEDALDQMSANQFDEMLKAFTSQNSVPTKSGENLPDGQ